MQLYEAMIVYHPDTGEASVKEALERVKQVIAGQAGEVTQVVEWGLKDLAYHIKKQRRGYYAIVEFKGTGVTVSELERNLRISDRVLRYITVQADPARPPLEAPKPRREPGQESELEAGEEETLEDIGDLETPELS
jgi:small subunit ribosomal protein S6